MDESKLVVAITGASSGIGRATARVLAGRGHAVALGARRGRELASLAAELTGSGGHAFHRVTDVTRREDLEALISSTIKQFGRLDAIVNNAGIGPLSRFDELEVADWDAMIDVNLRGTLYGIAAALPVFRQQGHGHIVNIVSTSGVKIVPTQGVYAATKNAVRTATEALRQESGPNIRVTEISPGRVATDFVASSDEEKRIAATEALKRIGIPPEAIGRGVLFALEQPRDVEVGSIVIRPTAQD